ncbi:MAG: class I tRNA ligase family protein, partial [Patescibacteria group bacterium]
ADALRMGLIVGNTPGTTTALYEDKIRGYKHFANKLWNIARFVLENTKSMGNEKKIELNKTDATLEKELLALIKEVTEDMENFRFYLAGEKLYHYLWHTFADKILEESKSILQGKNAPAKASRQKLLYEMLTLQLRVLHPFIPFVTEAIWTLMPHNKDKSLLMIEEWPITNGN